MPANLRRCCWPAVESLFQALCDASALNPDSDMEEEGGAQLFFDEAEVRGCHLLARGVRHTPGLVRVAVSLLYSCGPHSLAPVHMPLMRESVS